MNRFIVIYTTFRDRTEADNIVDFLIEKKLIACANFLSLEARYFWEGKVANANEVGALLKTRSENWEAVKTEIEKIHSYKIPCIIKFDAESNKSYADWIMEETKVKGPAVHARVEGTLFINPGITPTPNLSIEEVRIFGDVYVTRSDIDGFGLFENRDFKRGEIVCFWNPKILTKEDLDKLDDSLKKYVSEFGGVLKLMGEPERYVNFSENNNTIPTRLGDLSIRNIKKGEEITSNYEGEEIETEKFIKNKN